MSVFKVITVDRRQRNPNFAPMAKTASRTTRMSDADYAVQVKLADDKGISVADAIRLSLRYGAPVARKKLPIKRK